MATCTFCDKPVDKDDPNNYREVRSWVTGPKLDGPKLREQTGRVAHKHCVDNLVHGQAPDQPELFEDEGPIALPGSVVSDEPGKVYKLTGEDSVHEAIQSQIRARALELQAQGPDEFPFDYYMHLAREELYP